MTKQSAAFTLRMSQLAEAMVGGVLRAFAARKDYSLPPLGTVGGCIFVDDDGDPSGKRIMKISITFGPGSSS